MNLQEARKILGLSDSSSLDDAKKKYKELSKKFHPDVNKDPNAEERFKEINAAYDRIKKGDDPINFQNSHQDPFSGFNPFTGFGNMGRSKTYQENAFHISLNTNISFKESVKGIKKEISFSRKIKCDSCNGQGIYKIHNGCEKCNGMGTITRQQGNMIFTQTCDKCHGKNNTNSCNTCSGKGYVQSESTVQIKIPGGVVSGNILALHGMGNYVGSFMMDDQYTDAHLQINVEKSNLSLNDKDVISNLNISLHDAVIGCSKIVETIDGEKEIDIKPLSKHKDEVILPNMGVPPMGSQKVILNVSYPDNIIDLISSSKE